jgi:hypothetical protein
MDADEPYHPRRPLLIWLIAGFMGCYSTWLLGTFFVVASGLTIRSDAQQAYFKNLNWLDISPSLLELAANAVASIGLLLWRKIAFSLFSVGFALGFGAFLWKLRSTGWPPPHDEFGGFGAIVGWGTRLAICIYCWKLVRKGLLR